MFLQALAVRRLGDGRVLAVREVQEAVVPVCLAVRAAHRHEVALAVVVTLFRAPLLEHRHVELRFVSLRSRPHAREQQRHCRQNRRLVHFCLLLLFVN